MLYCLSAFISKNNTYMHAHIHTVMLKFPNEYLMNKHFNYCKNFKMKDNVRGTVKVETLP